MIKEKDGNMKTTHELNKIPDTLWNNILLISMKTEQIILRSDVTGRN